MVEIIPRKLAAWVIAFTMTISTLAALSFIVSTCVYAESLFSEIDIGPDQSKTVYAGTMAYYDLAVTNNQNITDSFDITSDSEFFWDVDLLNGTMSPLSDTNGNGVPDTGNVPAGGFSRVIVIVSVPVAPNSSSETTTVYATSFVDSEKSDSAILHTNVVVAELVPPHSDEGVDVDGDGLLDSLRVSVRINVTITGYYYANGDLYDKFSNPLYLSEYNGTVLYPGEHEVEIEFTGWQIRNKGVDGPYKVNLKLAIVGWQTIDSGVHTTNAYSWSQFELAPAEFVPPHSDYGLDSDSDGLYEYLVVNLSTNISTPGLFVFQAAVHRYGWDFITTTCNRTELEAGLQVVELRFKGWHISKYGADGPYTVAVGVYESPSDSMDSDLYTTAAYLANQFDVPPLAFCPPHADYGLDQDGDGLFDCLVVDVNLEVSTPGYYVISSDLWTYVGTVEASATNYTHLDAGLVTVSLFFAGWRFQVAGHFDVSYAEIDLFENEVLINTTTHPISAYSPDEFEPPPVILVPPHSDYGVDTDGDGLLNYLVVDAVLQVNVAGEYYFYGMMMDRYDYIIFIATTGLFAFEPGIHVVSLMFPGWSILSRGVDGNFSVEISVSSVASGTIATDVHTTGNYSLSQFQSSPALLLETHSEHVVDIDADGQFDQLVIDVQINVTVAGNYTLDGVLRDLGANNIVFGSNYSYLGVGLQVMELTFPGWPIRRHAQNGPYVALFGLFEHTGAGTDWGSYVTSPYLYTDFDLSAPRIVSQWTYLSPTIDGEMSVGEWADAVVVDLAYAGRPNNLPAFLLVKNNATHLFLAYDVTGDETNTSEDTSSIAFDTGNDGVARIGADDEFALGSWIPFDEAHYIYAGWGEWGIDCSPFDTSAADHEGLSARMGFGPSDNSGVDHRIFEYCIPLSLIDVDPGGIIGFLGGRSGYNSGLLDGSSWRYNGWPLNGSAVGDMNCYGELLIAPCAVHTCVSFSGTQGENGWYVSPVTVTLEARNASGGLNSTSYRIEGGSWQVYTAPFTVDMDGIHTLEYYSSDNEGNTEPIKISRLMIDSVSPETTHVVEGLYNVTLFASDSTSGVAYIEFRIDAGSWETYAGKITVSASGQHTVEFRSIDRAGNIEASHSIDVGEAIAPVSSVSLEGELGALGWFVSVVTVSITASDLGGSGVASIHFRIDEGSWQQYEHSFTVSEDGMHEMDFYSVDNASNAELTQTVVFGIDLSSPTTVHTLAGTLGENDWYTSDVTVSLTSSDNVGGSGLSQTRYRIDSSPWQSYGAAFSVSSRGLHTVEYYSVDSAGNVESGKTFTLKIDAAAPITTHVVTGTLGQNGWYRTSVSIALLVTDSVGGSGVDEARYRIDDGQWQTYTDAVSISDDGTFVVEFYAVDNAGNMEAKNTVTVKVDKTAPSTTAIVENGTVTLTVEDVASGPAQVRYRIDGGAWFDYTSSIVVVGRGNHTIEFYSVDSAGNIEAVKTTWVEIGGGGGVLGGAAVLALAIAAVAVVTVVAVWLLYMRKKKSVGEGPGGL